MANMEEFSESSSVSILVHGDDTHKAERKDKKCVCLLMRPNSTALMCVLCMSMLIHFSITTNSYPLSQKDREKKIDAPLSMSLQQCTKKGFKQFPCHAQCTNLFKQ